MTNAEILKHIDHTLLKPFATWEDIERLCEEAIYYKTASVCIPPSYVSWVKNKFGNRLKICTVIGFPLGYSVTAAKVEEAKRALEDGADEIDMVINIADAKNGDFHKIKEEIAVIKNTVGGKILKVIIETCFLAENEKIELCKAVTEAGADYIKTSTGFGTDGAKIEDIRLFKKYIGPDVKIKAAGGIKSIEQIEMFLKEGCHRIGTSSAVKLFEEEQA